MSKDMNTGKHLAIGFPVKSSPALSAGPQDGRDRKGQEAIDDVKAKISAAHKG